ncbi:MAG: exonuclease [Methanobacteriota archaeon]|nr:MAG: exonuclease [Euryarchaeota archaeon]
MDFPTKKKYVAVIDFEATCSDKGEIPRNETEIIEFACIMIDRDLKEIARFDQFVKPTLHPQLTEFCTNLTSITQEMVNQASSFPEVLNAFKKAIIEPFDPLFASWGRYDRNQLVQDCRLHKVPYPFDDEHLDLKRWLPKFLPISKPKSINGMLKYLGLNFIGTPHRGIDDVRNIVRILEEVSPLIPD